MLFTIYFYSEDIDTNLYQDFLQDTKPCVGLIKKTK